MKKRPVLAATGVAALVLASVVVSAAPANAALSQCSANRACGWTDSNYSGAFAQWSASASTLGAMNDQISSDANNRASSVTFYTGAAQTGSAWTVPAGGGGYFSPLNWQNDSFSSIRI